jgi:hypothetical protein
MRRLDKDDRHAIQQLTRPRDHFVEFDDMRLCNLISSLWLAAPEKKCQSSALKREGLWVNKFCAARRAGSMHRRDDYAWLMEHASAHHASYFPMDC